jgi:hypothetical protein
MLAPKSKTRPGNLPEPRFRMLEYQLWILQGAYFEEVVVLVVAVLLLFLCLLFFVVFVVLSVEVFCAAKTAVPESSERPRAAVMSFFILGDISLITTLR